MNLPNSRRCSSASSCGIAAAGWLLVAGVLGLANAAHADFMEATASVAAGSDQHTDADTASNVLGDPQAFASTSAAITDAFGTAAARAEAGSLGISMRASASATEVTKSDARAVFRDALLVTSSLPVGTPVTLTFDLTPPPAGAIGVCSTCFIGFVTADFNLIFGSAIRDKAVTWSQGVTGFSQYSGPFTSNLARVGDTISIEGTLTGQLVVGRPTGAADFLISLLNTVPFFAQAQTPGVTLVAQSGHDYSISAVPEPGSVWLLGGGLAVLLGLSRLKTRRR